MEHRCYKIKCHIKKNNKMVLYRLAWEDLQDLLLRTKSKLQDNLIPPTLTLVCMSGTVLDTGQTRE